MSSNYKWKLSKDSSDVDGFFSLIWLALFLGGGLLLIFFVGLIVVPAVVAGGGALYYLNNFYWPRKAEEEKSARTRIMYQEAKRIAPPLGEFFDRIEREGIQDETLKDVAMELYDMEGLAPPDEPPALSNTIEAGRYRDKLLKYVENARPEHFTRFMRELVSILKTLETPGGSGIFQSRVRRSPQQIDDLIMQFFRTDDCFKDLRNRLDKNYNEQNSVTPEKYTGDNCAWDYLKDTPLLELEYVEQWITLSNRTYHTHILGASGAGKSNLIEYLISRDLTGDEDNCVVLIDSQVQMIPKLADVDIDVDDVTYITPSWNLALNLFDVGYSEMKKAGAEGERLINTTVDLISFVLEGMMGTQLSDPQKTIFQYAIQLVITIPGGNIFTFFDLLADNGHLKYAEQINQFDENTKSFFLRDFGSDEYKRSRDAIRRRLQSMLRNPTFRRLFSATENKVNMYEELQKRKLILIDTNLPMLGKDASAFFGRLFIALIVQASHRRFDNRNQSYKPAYVFIDEAHEYFDEKISEILEQARKANIGLIVAHQSVSQAKNEQKNIIDPLMVNTATKIVATGYSKDASVMAGSMQTTANEIIALPQYTFGMYSRETGFVPIRAVAEPLKNLPSRYNKSELKEAIEERYGASAPVSDRDISDVEIPDEDYPSPGVKANGAKLPKETNLGDVNPI